MGLGLGLGLVRTRGPTCTSYRQEPWKEKYEGTWYEYPGYPLAAAAAGGNPLNQVGLRWGEPSPSPSP